MDKLHRRAIRGIMTTSDIKWKIKVAAEGKPRGSGKTTGAMKKKAKRLARNQAAFIVALDELEQNQ